MIGPIRLAVATAQDMSSLGSELSRLLRVGDVVILNGELGAGKTQLAQGIGRGLGVRGEVISPTFVLSRVHRSEVGPDMVHVDAYRLTSSYEVDDLDLEAEMPTSVIVVEWGRGFVEFLSESYLDITINRSQDIEDDTRHVEIVATGPRWENFLTDWEALINVDMGRDARRDADGSGDE
ncbi:MAG: tRNA (adenosine(37)-N6)-threonylcarbamoyltransferase complex ATPase subunit type 1 TsaE [Propionibacteriaceae bacterium]|nr:tRNA (adenosine(37)-N6)-threonylcarbamoyltransferase complex ATPase subunit type 1 TsaE [Propionibacteriaceae bacterium]